MHIKNRGFFECNIYHLKLRDNFELIFNTESDFKILQKFTKQSILKTIR